MTFIIGFIAFWAVVHFFVSLGKKEEQRIIARTEQRIYAGMYQGKARNDPKTSLN
jgi:hypothetical protein